jgi:hypothetical protein
VIILVVNTILLFVLPRLSCHHQKENFVGDTQSTIPKIIWTYWNDGIDNAPKLVKNCIKTWEIHNKDYDIRILTQDNYRDYVPNVDVVGLKHADSHQHIADFIRCHVLATYGGIWCDASIAMTRSLSWVHDVHIKNNSEFVGFYLEAYTTIKEFPVIENWFFACSPQAKFVTLWRDEFMKVNNYENVSDYVKYIEQDTIVDKIDMKEYLAMHLAAQKVLQKYLSKQERNMLSLFKAEDGPFLYLVKENWNSERSLKSLCDVGDKDMAFIIKFRSGERKQLENDDDLNTCLEKRLFHKK